MENSHDKYRAEDGPAVSGYEIEPEAINTLNVALEVLGFIETAEVREVSEAFREEWIDARGVSDRLSMASVVFDERIETIVDAAVTSTDQLGRERAHIALILYKASLFRELGDMDRYRSSLQTAYAYAIHSRRYDDTIISLLQAEFDLYGWVESPDM